MWHLVAFKHACNCVQRRQWRQQRQVGAQREPRMLLLGIESSTFGSRKNEAGGSKWRTCIVVVAWHPGAADIAMCGGEAAAAGAAAGGTAGATGTHPPLASLAATCACASYRFIRLFTGRTRGSQPVLHSLATLERPGKPPPWCAPPG